MTIRIHLAHRAVPALLAFTLAATLAACSSVDEKRLADDPAVTVDAGDGGDSLGTGGNDVPVAGNDNPPDVDPVLDGCRANPDSETCPQICPELCNDEDDDCDGTTDEGTDDTDCAVDNADSVCVDGLCLLAACDDGFRDCNGDIADGCEASIGGIDHCGGCGIVCSFDNAIPACVAGACEPAGCVEPFLDCDGSPEVCETPGDTLLNCGGCGIVCANPPRATAACTDGACMVDECIGNFGDCNGLPEDGCELELSEPSNCGACGIGCAFVGSVADCTTGVCIATDCGPSYAECDGDATNGCESLSDANHCGGCGQVCTLEALSNVAVASCDDGVCNSACLPLFDDCDGQPNGCETPLTTNSNCGGCGVTCNPAHAVGECGDGSCGIGQCADGWADCDGDVGNGCEANLTNPATCGRCDQQCEPNIGCSSGVCRGITCDPGLADCDGNDTCETMLSDDATCGACNVSCEFDGGVDGHGSIACAPDGGALGYACEVTCADGFADCDDDYRNGCEVDLTALDSCGSCGSVCSKQHASVTCENQICEVATCALDWGDCDGDGLSCESQLNTTGNCGACGNSCDYANAAGACLGSPGSRTCDLVACNPVEFADCDMDEANGCEVDTRSDIANCDGCGISCDNQPHVQVASCQGSSCNFDVCEVGYDDCTSAAGCETDITRVASCGGCDVNCDDLLPNTYSTTCGQAQTCGIGSCNAGFASCDANALTGCETQTSTDPANCGGCASLGQNDRCTALANVTTSACSAGDCVINTCGNGFANCNADTTDGCETNTGTDAAACGACGNDCAALPHVQSAGCSSGLCGALVCDAGYLNCNGDVNDGCETDATDPSTCGDCNTDCDSALPNTETTTCGAGLSCGVGTCVAGYDSCDDNPLSGCEQNIAMDEANCGGCASRGENTPCENLPQVVTSTCSAGTCSVTTCEAGFEDCNQDSADGCEWEPAVDGMCCDPNSDADGDGTDDCADECVNDPAKQVFGVCGCGVSDADTDGDGLEDCYDACVDDPDKQVEGVCGCGVADTDTDGDGFQDCLEACFNDPAKQDPGVCGCDVSDADSDGDGFEDCNENCDSDPTKQEPGACGCGVSDADSDGDGFEDCNETCDNDGNKQDPGVCGCGVGDDDTDGDGTFDCNDECPYDAGIVAAGDCGCPSSPAAGGTACGDGACSENVQCDGAGTCGAPIECVPHRTISTGEDTACAVDGSGRVICWGDGGYGQLGNGSNENYRRTGNFVGNLYDAIDVAVGAGGDHACATREGGSVVCWGEGAYGRLGNGSTNDQYLPVTVTGITTAIQVVAGRDFSCALLDSGEVRCWGEGASGRLGRASTTDSNLPVTVLAGETGAGNLSGVMSLAAGEEHACAVLQGGHAVCWGNGGWGRLGDSNSTDRTTPVYVHGVGDVGTCDANDQSGCLAGVTQLAAGENATLAIHGGEGAGLVSSWGADDNNESGVAGAGAHDYPMRVTGVGMVGTLDDAVWIGMGLHHGCAVRPSGQAVCWGENDQGRLGDNGASNNPDFPQVVSGATDYVQIDAGDLFSCARTAGGHVRCFGDNGQGNLATGVSTDSNVAVEMAGTRDPFVEIDSGMTSCAATDSGEVYCWGRQVAGEIGNTSYPISTDVWAPVKVDGIDNAIDVERGEYTSCALLSDQTVKCWGDNIYYNLGQGPTAVDSQTPVVVLAAAGTPLTGITALASAWISTCALKSDGTVWCWGYAGYGTLGNATTGPSQGYAVQVHGVNNVGMLTGVDAIGAGRHHMCATQGSSPNRTIVCWGYNGGRQLGDGTATNRSSPVAVGGGQTGFGGTWGSISGGVFNTCALKENGEAWCWGYDVLGKNGDGTAGGYDNNPVKVTGGLDDFVVISDDSDDASSVCAARAGGDAYCWGYNDNGERGDEGVAGTLASPARVHFAEAAIAQGNTDFLSPVISLGSGYHTKTAVHANGAVSAWGYNAAGQLGTGYTGDKFQPVRLGVPVR